MRERPYLVGLFLVLLVVIAAGAVMAAGGAFTESPEERRMREQFERLVHVR